MRYDTVPITTLEETVATANAQAEAESTIETVRSTCSTFKRWADERALPCEPTTGETLLLYLAAGAPQWTPRYLAKISGVIRRADVRAGWPDPGVGADYQAVVHDLQSNFCRPLVPQPVAGLELLDLIVELAPKAFRSDFVVGRVATMLRFGFGSALRGAELCSLSIEQMTRVRGGRLIRGPTKSDPFDERPPREVSDQPNLPWCPNQTLDAWLELNGITSGAVFRPNARATGDPHRSLVLNTWQSELARLSVFARQRLVSHDLRRMLVTEAARQNKAVDDVLRTTGQLSEDMAVLYTRCGLFDGPGHVIGRLTN